MPCYHVDLPGGGHAIITLAKQRRKICACGNIAPNLCDAPVTRRGKPATCDKGVCPKCSTQDGEGHDYCLEHSQ
jgi:hypothetical protein